MASRSDCRHCVEFSKGLHLLHLGACSTSCDDTTGTAKAPDANAQAAAPAACSAPLATTG